MELFAEKELDTVKLNFDKREFDYYGGWSVTCLVELFEHCFGHSPETNHALFTFFYNHKSKILSVLY